MADWNALLDRVETTPRSPLRPQMVIRALSDLMAEDWVHTAAACEQDATVTAGRLHRCEIGNGPPPATGRN
jgi:hypothetical protein